MNIAKAHPLEQDALNGLASPWPALQRNSRTKRRVSVNVSPGTPDFNFATSAAPLEGAQDVLFGSAANEQIEGLGGNDAGIGGIDPSATLKGLVDTFTDLSTHDYSSHISDASLKALYTRASVAIKGGGSISAADLSTLQDLSKKIAGCAYSTRATGRFFIKKYRRKMSQFMCPTTHHHKGAVV